MKWVFQPGEKRGAGRIGEWGTGQSGCHCLSVLTWGKGMKVASEEH